MYVTAQEAGDAETEEGEGDEGVGMADVPRPEETEEEVAEGGVFEMEVVGPKTS